MQKIYIVGVNKSFSEYSDMLMNLIKKRGIEATFCTYEEYQKNESMSDVVFQDSKLIFVGADSSGKTAIPNIASWEYERFACYIGWKEAKCVVFARNGDLPYADYKEFRNYCRRVQLSHTDVIVPPDSPVAEEFEAVKGIFTDKNKSAHRAQYSTLIYEFMDNYFDRFIQYESNYGIANLADILRKQKRSTSAKLTWKQKMLCHAIIATAAGACAAAAFIPIPVADAIPITAAQITMVIALGKVFNHQITKTDAQRLLKIAAVPLVGRALAKNLLIFMPGVGWGINAAIAGIITEILGWSIVSDFVAKSKK